MSEEREARTALAKARVLTAVRRAFDGHRIQSLNCGETATLLNRDGAISELIDAATVLRELEKPERPTLMTPEERIRWAQCTHADGWTTLIVDRRDVLAKAHEFPTIWETADGRRHIPLDDLAALLEPSDV